MTIIDEFKRTPIPADVLKELMGGMKFYILIPFFCVRYGQTFTHIIEMRNTDYETSSLCR